MCPIWVGAVGIRQGAGDQDFRGLEGIPAAVRGKWCKADIMPHACARMRAEIMRKKRVRSDALTLELFELALVYRLLIDLVAGDLTLSVSIAGDRRPSFACRLGAALHHILELVEFALADQV